MILTINIAQNSFNKKSDIAVCFSFISFEI